MTTRASGRASQSPPRDRYGERGKYGERGEYGEGGRTDQRRRKRGFDLFDIFD